MAHVYAFIDSQNLNLSIKDQGWRLDFERFYVFLSEKYKVKKAFLFLGKVQGNDGLYKSLSQMGYELVFRPTVVGKSGFVKGNCDTELVLHCAKIQYNNYSKAIVVSGDGDFYSLVEFLLKNDKLLLIGIPNHQRFSSLLRGFSSSSFYISHLKKKLEYKKR